MDDRVIELLTAMGYPELSDNDRAILAFAIAKVESYILNEINHPSIPKGLEEAAICRVIGEFLTMKKTFSPADLSMLDLTPAVKQIQAGDTNFVLSESGQTDEQRLAALIDRLLLAGQDQFSAFRRIRW